MRTVDIGVGHDDDPLVTQPLKRKSVAEADPQRHAQIADFDIAVHFRSGSSQNIENFSPQRKQGLGFPVAGHFGRAARRVALDQKNLGSVALRSRKIHQFAGQSQFPGCRLARRFLLGSSPSAFLGPASRDGRSASARSPCRPPANCRSGPLPNVRRGAGRKR